jgi:hypothetical protein
MYLPVIQTDLYSFAIYRIVKHCTMYLQLYDVSLYRKSTHTQIINLKQFVTNAKNTRANDYRIKCDMFDNIHVTDKIYHIYNGRLRVGAEC